MGVGSPCYLFPHARLPRRPSCPNWGAARPRLAEHGLTGRVVSAAPHRICTPHRPRGPEPRRHELVRRGFPLLVAKNTPSSSIAAAPPPRPPPHHGGRKPTHGYEATRAAAMAAFAKSWRRRVKASHFTSIKATA